MEIERKFLINDVSLKPTKSVEITQYYLSHIPEIRIRRMSTIHCDNFYLTIKIDDTNMTREEIEIPIENKIFFNLKSKAKSVICKTRYYIDLDNNLTAEIDEYDNGLKIVEVEFKDLTQAESFIPPDWFGKEITDDKMYRNISLSQKIE